MKILHTADIHLTNLQDERWETLKQLLRIGGEEDVDLFIIVGDLFNKTVDSEILHSQMRTLFSGNDFDIIILPGNHDMDSYEKRVYFGDNVRIIRTLEEPIEYEEVLIFGMPFESMGSKELREKIRSIKNRTKEDKKNILLFHGEVYDFSFNKEDFGEESRYMGARLAYFEGLNLDYILSGHFHSRFHEYTLKDGGYFVYPGSPISLTRKEKGPRAINIFELGTPPKEYRLNTPYYEEIRIEFSPFDQINPIEIVQREIDDKPEEAKILLRVEGFTQRDEREVNRELADIAKKSGRVELDNRLHGISYILEDELFLIFNEKLMELKHPMEDEIRKLFIQAMIQVKVK
ncbi:metallophosphoesterase [candidate division WOR-3 bacterium]|nr:metallophosphoesterase [candidate division WOR-3 bacterium]